MAKNYLKKITDTELRIGEVRFSYVSVFQRKRAMDGSQGKYGVTLLIPKEDTVTVKALEQAIDSAKQQGKSGKWGGKVPVNCKSPLRDGDTEKEDENFAGMYFINANCDNAPGVKMLSGGRIVDAMDEEDFYSGCWGAAVISLFPYDSNGNRGVGAGLNHVMKTRDDKKLSGGISADAAFGDLGDLDELD